jgi:transcriptional regulator with XRE-family HTH domain
MNINIKVLDEAGNYIAGFIRLRREELQMTQQELADKCGIGVRTVVRLESGKFWLNVKQLVVILYHLNSKITLTSKN